MNKKRKDAMTLNTLRKQLTATQRAILNKVFAYNKEHRITPASFLYREFGKEIVHSEMASLGGSIIYRTSHHDSSRKFYQLTFLGELLTEQGPEMERLILRYLEYVRRRLAENDQLNGVKGQDLKDDLGFTQEQLEFFRGAIGGSVFWNSGNFERDEWLFFLPPEVDELAVTPDIQAFFEVRALSKYDPNKPIDLQHLYAYDGSLLRTSTEDPQDSPRYIQVSRAKLWLLVIGLYVVYFLYRLSAVAGNYEGMQSLWWKTVWGTTFTQTIWVLPIVIGILLVATVLGVEQFFRLLERILPISRRLFLLQPIDARTEERQSNNSEAYSVSPAGREEISEGIGPQLHLDYHESVKKVYNNAILQYRNSFYVSLLSSVVGFGLIFYALVWRTDSNPNWPAVFVSAVIQSVPALFFYLSDRARKQMIEVFVDLRRDNEVARAYELLNTIRDENRQEELKDQIIRHTLLNPLPSATLSNRREATARVMQP